MRGAGAGLAISARGMPRRVLLSQAPMSLEWLMMEPRAAQRCYAVWRSWVRWHAIRFGGSGTCLEVVYCVQHGRRPAVSEALSRQHGRPTRKGSLSSLPSASSGAITAQPPGFLSPLPTPPSHTSGQMHGPYGNYGQPVAIPPGYMLVPAPGAMQVLVLPVPCSDVCLVHSIVRT